MTSAARLPTANVQAPPGPYLSFSKVAGQLGVCRVSVWRWATQGIVVNGRRIKLGMYKIGGVFRTVQADVDAFVAAQNDGPESGSACPATPTTPTNPASDAKAEGGQDVPPEVKRVLGMK